jgi:hypothetical protein
MQISVSDGDRERAADMLQQACGEGRLTLEEFSDRVGTVWAAETSQELVKATGDIAPAPLVGSTQTIDRITTVFSETKRHGRWRLRDGLRATTVFGTCELDLREILTSADVIEITGICAFSELKVIVPEGVDVEIGGPNWFSSQKLRLAPRPRLPGTPLIRVRVTAAFSSVSAISSPR